MGKPGFDVVVVMGVGLSPTGGPSRAMRRRMGLGIEMFKKSGAQALLVTGGPAGGAVTEADIMRDLALDAGLDPSRIVLEPTARSTYENAHRSARIIRDRGWSRALVVTDRVHVPRALLSFRNAGIRVRGAGVSSGWRDGPFRTKLHYVFYEIAGIIWYAAMMAGGHWTDG